METPDYKIKAIKENIIDVDQKEGIVKTYINTFNLVDAYNEVSLPGSFRKNFSESLKKIYWLRNHNWDEMPGVAKELYEDGKGAIAVGQINMKKQLGVDLWNDYLLFAEHGRSLEHSIRTVPIKYTRKHSKQFNCIGRGHYVAVFNIVPCYLPILVYAGLYPL